MRQKIFAYLFASSLLAGLVAAPLITQQPTVAFAQDDVPGFEAQASQLVDDIVAGRFATVGERFDPTMLDVQSEEGLASAWLTYQEVLGSFQSAGQPHPLLRGHLTVEQVPVQLARSEGEIRIVFHPDGTIAGHFFLRTGVPVP
jgi:hypothetical protein